MKHLMFLTAFLRTARRSPLTAHHSLLTPHCSWLSACRSRLTASSILRFVIPNSRLLSSLTTVLLTAHYSPLTAAFATTPGFDTLVNYDTAWTYVYDGGTSLDVFYDVKCLSNGVCVCVGVSADSITRLSKSILMKFDASGKILLKKFYTLNNDQYAHALAIAKNGDFIIGGVRNLGPYTMRTDSAGNLKWATWYYDSVGDKTLLKGKGTINSIFETDNGNIICAAGDPYPFNDGQPLNNYAAFLSLDSLGKIKSRMQWSSITGYIIGGFYIEQVATGYYLFSGNQAVFYLDSSGSAVWQKGYSFDLTGVGTVSNNVARAKMLRDSSLMVAGQAYEGNCWTRYKKLYYDAWWSPISYAYGPNSAWDTAGIQGLDDVIYDFTQLKNGNLVFVGSKGGPNGIWAFVTDSTGKKLFWDKEFPVRYLNEPGKGASAKAYSVCSTDDGGFTAVGDVTLSNALGVHNALIAHFVPRPVSAVILRNKPITKSVLGFNVYVTGAKLIVETISPFKDIGEVAVFDVFGRQIATRTDKKEMAFDISHLSNGTYIVRLKSGSVFQAMKFAIEH